jgi:hypothetical protein
MGEIGKDVWVEILVGVMEVVCAGMLGTQAASRIMKSRCNRIRFMVSTLERVGEFIIPGKLSPCLAGQGFLAPKLGEGRRLVKLVIKFFRVRVLLSAS